MKNVSSILRKKTDGRIIFIIYKEFLQMNKQQNLYKKRGGARNRKWQDTGEEINTREMCEMFSLTRNKQSAH